MKYKDNESRDKNVAIQKIVEQIVNVCYILKHMSIQMNNVM